MPPLPPHPPPPSMGQVFLLSTRAGGAGLNLVGANHLVLYDRWEGGRERAGREGGRDSYMGRETTVQRALCEF